MELKHTVSDEYMHAMLRSELYRVCNATGDSLAFSSSAYSSHKAHADLLATCKGCNRDTSELERAIEARNNAELHLKHVTEIETSYLRKAVDSHRITAFEENLT